MVYNANIICIFHQTVCFYHFHVQYYSFETWSSTILNDWNYEISENVARFIDSYSATIKLGVSDIWVIQIQIFWTFDMATL
jgi:hypothetical protein